MTGMALELAVSPDGHFYLETVACEFDLPDAAVARRIRKSFAAGSAAGLLDLGAIELASSLPPSLAYGRGLAYLFMARLCAIPDLESQWARAELPAPRDDLARLAAAAPPLTGAEYLDLERLEVLWADLRTVAREKIAAAGGSPHTWLKEAHPSWNLVGRVCFHLAENRNDERDEDGRQPPAGKPRSGSSRSCGHSSSIDSKSLCHPLPLPICNGTLRNRSIPGK